MSRVRLIITCLLAALAVSAVAADLASANQNQGKRVCEEGSNPSGEHYETKAICESGEGPVDPSGKWIRKELENKTKILGTSGVSKLRGEISKTEIILTCNKDKLTGLLEKAGASSGSMTFEECSIGDSKETFKSCEVPNITFNFTGQLVGSKVLEMELQIKSEVVIGSCTLKGKYLVTGTQVCKLPGGETPKIEHEIDCTPAGSKLELDGKECTFEGLDKVSLESKEEWFVEK